MFQIKKLLGGTLSLRDHNAQISKTCTMIKASNKMAKLGIPKIEAIV
ncbi:Mobile element protein [Candidatus Enterovibrio altilux]|uniref:Mobile element protein n=1 Tax=Candidatus Enterovibrio altilux TaxID=1927128 RepID=A0A291B7R1_9GAMM|nr:Mobile element protein [Candidatus Enterovibrio luxaltus]